MCCCHSLAFLGKLQLLTSLKGQTYVLYEDPVYDIPQNIIQLFALLDFNLKLLL